MRISTAIIREKYWGELANGKNTVEITARIGAGEVLTAYTGKLVK